MKNLVLIVFAFLFLGVNQAFAYRVTDFSTDAKIVEAVRVLEQAGETDVVLVSGSLSFLAEYLQLEGGDERHGASR